MNEAESSGGITAATQSLSASVSTEDETEEKIFNQEISQSKQQPVADESLWKKSQEVEMRGRDEEFDDYLNDLLL